MIEWLLITLIGVLVLTLVTYFVWQKSTINWAYSFTSAIVFSLPFERIPSIDIANITLRPSQILTLFASYIVFILFLKKDQGLEKIKFNKVTYWFLGFLVLSIPSWFMVENFKKFLASELATILVFSTFFLVSNFTKNIRQAFLTVIASFSVVGIFTIWQFGAGMVGFPTYLTGLIEHYTTKEVFGFPRLHATFLEPLYFAGGLFIPMFTFFFLAISNTNIFENITLKNKAIEGFLKTNYNNIFYTLTYIFAIFFLLTVSKGAWLTFILTGSVALIVGFKYFNMKKFVSLSFKISLVLVTSIVLLATFSGTVQSIILKTTSDLNRSLTGESVTVIERKAFINSAISLIEDNPITGVGPGNYGTASKYNLENIRQDTTNLIANNIYVEAWAEYGFLAYIVFLSVFIITIYQNFKSINWIKIKELDIYKLILGFALVSYMIQWNTFSPLYITPIFIIFGLMVSLKNKKSL